MSKNHHYVPQFYMRKFASKPNRINILNVDNNFSHASGPIKGQCYRKYFHGKDEEMERALAVVEAAVAPILHRIVKNLRFPKTNSPDYELLVFFIALQLGRTSSASERLTESFQQTAVLMQQNHRSYNLDHALRMLGVSREESVELNMNTTRFMYNSLLSVELHLLVNETALEFVTSDNPAFKYNWFCEGVTRQGILGSDRSGFMVFLPLSPRVVLVAYDQDVYKLGVRGSFISPVTSLADVLQINLMQAINCESVVLFSNWSDLQQHETTSLKARGRRARPRTSVTEWEDTYSPDRRTIMWSFETCPDLRLDLSFLSLKKEARAMPMPERLKRYRRGTGIRVRAQTPVDPDDPRWRRISSATGSSGASGPPRS